jgi:hypothetical protein
MENLTAFNLPTFLKNNGGFDLSTADLNSDRFVASLNWGDSGPALDQLKALQRLKRLVPDSPAPAQKPVAAMGARDAQAPPISAPDPIEALAAANFDSAHSITAAGKQKFVDTMSTLGEPAAAQIYEAAEQRTNQVMHAFVQAQNLSAPYFKALRANAVSPGVNSYFEGMEGYQDIFGGLNYCDCAECKSIFGAAAYFVDLLRIIDTRVTQPSDSMKMSFDQRRPDLKQIPLTCENTNQTIPYVDIVNERLADALSEPGPGGDPYQSLSTAKFPFNLPFHLPLTKIRASLGRLNASLSDIWRLLGAPDQNVAAELIGVSPEEWTLLTTSHAGDALKECYGVQNLADLNARDTFCKQTGLTVLQLQELLTQNLSDDELAAKLNDRFFINPPDLANLVALSGAQATTVNGTQWLTHKPFTLAVAETSGFASAGALTVTRADGVQVVIQYTGVTGAAFTGCTASPQPYPMPMTAPQCSSG